MPDCIPPQRDYRTWLIDSTRWERVRLRPDDIVIATYLKAGTTWTQRIVDLLVFQTTEARPLGMISAWVDFRRPGPIEPLLERLAAQPHRRFLKSHLPLDGLPWDSRVKYIHVARDGRDVALSLHNHIGGYTAAKLAEFDQAGLEDPAIGLPYPRVPADAAAFFHWWLTATPTCAAQAEEPGLSAASFFHFERNWWAARQRPNVLFVHYADLLADLAGEMRRIADFLGIAVPAATWPELVAAARFEAMRREGDAILAQVATAFEGGGTRFFHQGINGRWRRAFRAEDLALYAAAAEAALPPAARRWVEHGRLTAGDPAVIAE